MQQWRLLGFFWGLFFVGGVLGMRSYEELAGAETGSPVSQLTPIGSRTAVARSGAHRGRQLQAELNRLTVQDLFLNNLKQKGAAADLAGPGNVEVDNVLVAPPRYHSNAELQEYLQGYVQRCGHLATLEQFGNSTLGNPLWALEISDHPGEEEAEPAFKFVGNMHGDEPSGRELVLYLAEWLCQNYGVDNQATRIVQQLHVFLVPSLNPDGFDQRNRGNPNGVDLNRDFPDQFFANNNDLATRQAETLALMNWTLSHRFTAGASLHEGAVVANYPWDGSTDQGTHYAAAPDDAAFRHLATAYARGHAHMWNSSEFEGGITNGAAWYPLYGGMQDWNYLHAGCLDITIEVAENKWPPPEQLPSLWSEHKGAMLALLDVLAKSGLHGTVTSALDRSALLAQIEVEGAGRPVWTRALLGDYHRVLAPGTYVVHVAAPGFVNVTANATVTTDLPTVLDFRLSPDPGHTPQTYSEGSSGRDGLRLGSGSGKTNGTQALLGQDNATWGQAEGEEAHRAGQLFRAGGTDLDASLLQSRRGEEGGEKAGRWLEGGLEVGDEAKLPQVRKESALAWPRVQAGGGISAQESELQSDEMRQVAGELMQARLRGAQGQRGIALEDSIGQGGAREEEEEEEEEEGDGRSSRGQRGQAVTKEKLTAAKGAFDEKDDRQRTGDFGRSAGWQGAEEEGREVLDGAKRTAERKRVEWGVGHRENTDGADGLDERVQAAGAEGRGTTTGGLRITDGQFPKTEGASSGDVDYQAEGGAVKKADNNRPFILGTGTFPGSPDIEERTLDSYYAEGRSTWNHLTMAMAVVFTFMLLILWSWLRGRRTRGYTPRGRPIRVTRVPQIGGPGLFRD